MQGLKSKRLLFLGGFPQMIEVVMTAKKMGVYTLLADRDPASPSKRFVDKAFDVSTNDIEALMEICKNEKVDGVFTGFEDFNIHIARELCSRLGLPFYATQEQLEIITNKNKFKDACRQNGVPIIEQYTLTEAEHEGKFPYIIKPSDSYGSRGITVCHNPDELRNGYAKALEASASKNTIIERFVDTPYGVELFYTIVNGHIHLTVTADRYVAKTGVTTVPLPVAEVFPSKHAEEMHGELDTSIRNMLANLGIENGLVLIQALYENGDFFVYEMAYRLTGEQHYRLVEKQHGINLAEMMIKLALGESVEDFDSEMIDDSFFRYPSINLAVLLKPGTIKKIEGLADVFQLNDVISYNLTHAEKDTVATSGNYSHMLIRVNMVSATYEKLCDSVSQVGKLVNVTSDQGEDMIAYRFDLKEGVR